MNELLTFNFIGGLHNYNMQELSKLSNFPNYSDEQLYDLDKNITEQVFQENGFDTTIQVSFEEAIAMRDLVLAQNDNYIPLFTNWKEDGKINEEQFQYLMLINSIFNNETDAGAISTELFAIQQSVSNSTTLSIDQKALIYNACSIGASSVLYWYSAYTNEENPWYQTKESNNGWIKRALLDLVGLTVGFLVGFEYGGLLGGSLLGGFTAVMCSAEHK